MRRPARDLPGGVPGTCRGYPQPARTFGLAVPQAECRTKDRDVFRGRNVPGCADVGKEGGAPGKGGLREVGGTRGVDRAGDGLIAARATSRKIRMG